MDALTTPSNWQRVRLWDIAEIKRGASPRPIENPKWFCANSNVGWVRISDISKNSRFLYKTAQKLSKKGIEKSRLVKQNSLIMSMCATIGKPIITKIDTCIHDGFVVFENPKIDLNYLYYFLCYIEKEWLESGQQGSQVNLNVDLIKNKEVFYPKDLNEQIAIANILSDVDRYLYSLDALILKKESVKKALSFELLSQRKRLKGFNQAWQKVRLGDIGKPCMCKRVMKHQTTRYGEIPFYKIGTFGNTADAFISKKLFLEYKTKYSFPKKGDILISASGTIGRAVIYDGKPAYFQDSNIVWIDNDETLVKNDFLFYAYSNIKWNTEHTTILRLYNDNFRNTLIPLPPLNEQIAIANILSALDNEIIGLKNKKRQFENIKKALNHDLMSAKIRVLKK
ncbi:type I restriction endonuclease subunit S [Helicobacter pylori]|uniref:restriction endonuclease subunit S n=1 Tax=Helicobacter pylori TaxID=210 RepID=UPI0009948506|nr:restriction endonuclease subunit S [Helicobacter pylori]OOQ01598.1 type I restriction endonuclease subunit S [Helicobacter pylori]PDW74070.1 type I restriction endonuclease subunit S [Helicobacter pylori]